MYNFEDIKGNDKIIRYFQSSISNNKVSHAYIIDAQKGMGKKLIGKVFAKTLQCENEKITPCNKCTSCITFDTNNNPDIIYVRPSKSKSVGVDDIREQIGKNIELKPYKYRYKIFIVEDADTMTVQAQNAILKTIEEPPPYGVFILLSSNYNNFLPTILSRCVMFKLKPLAFDLVKRYLIENISLGEDEAHIYSMYAQGNIGRALEISSSSEFMDMRDTAISVIEKLDEIDLVATFSTVKFFDAYKQNIYDILDIIYLCYRDSIIIKIFDDFKFIIQKDKQRILKFISDRNSLKILIKKSETVLNAKVQLKQNANFQMVMEVMLLKLKEKR